jgi:hypothetical protein
MMSQCSNCGAQLHQGKTDVQVCPYCGAETRVFVAEPTPTASTRRTRSEFPGAPRGLGAAGALVAVLVILALLLALRPRSGSSPSTPTASAKPKLSLANLATTPFSIEPIEAPGMLGTFASFDPIANYEWAYTIGRAWKADAVLFRIDVDRVARDGTVDVKNVPKAEVTYRFYSPGCITARKASTSVVAPTTKCGLFVAVMVDGDTPTALVNAVSEDSPSAALSSPVCTLAKAFGALAKAGKLPEKPVFNVTVFGLARPHWSIDSIQGETIGSVDATTCAVL